MDRLKPAATDAKTWSSDLRSARAGVGEILRCAQNDGVKATAKAKGDGEWPGKRRAIVRCALFPRQNPE